SILPWARPARRLHGMRKQGTFHRHSARRPHRAFTGAGPRCADWAANPGRGGAELAIALVVEARGSTEEPQISFCVFRDVVGFLKQAQIAFAVGGAFAFHYYTAFPATTKDLDLFLFGRDVERAVRLLAEAGFDAKIMQEHWLAKARREGATVDLIY